MPQTSPGQSSLHGSPNGLEDNCSRQSPGPGGINNSGPKQDTEEV